MPVTIQHNVCQFPIDEKLNFLGELILKIINAYYLVFRVKLFE